MRTLIAVAAVAALLGGASIAQADDSPSAAMGQPKLKTPHDPAVNPNKATTGSGVAAPSTAQPSNTPGVKGSKPFTPDTKAK